MPRTNSSMYKNKNIVIVIGCKYECWFFQVVLREPCIFAVENAHYIDCQSWDFLEDLVRDSHAVLVMTMKTLNVATSLPESGQRLIADTNTIKINLGKYLV